VQCITDCRLPSRESNRETRYHGSIYIVALSNHNDFRRQRGLMPEILHSPSQYSPRPHSEVKATIEFCGVHVGHTVVDTIIAFDMSSVLENIRVCVCVGVCVCVSLSRPDVSVM